MNRRGFLKALSAAAVLSAGGIALIEQEPIRAYFLPPRGGWNSWPDNSFELAAAMAALDVVNARIPGWAQNDIVVIESSVQHRDAYKALQRRAQLETKIAALLRGEPAPGLITREVMSDGNIFTTHGRRSRR